MKKSDSPTDSSDGTAFSAAMTITPTVDHFQAPSPETLPPPPVPHREPITGKPRYGRRGPGRPKKGSYQFTLNRLPKEAIAAMVANGMTSTEIGNAFGINQASAWRAAAQPEVKDLVRYYREHIKQIHLERGTKVAPKLWDKAEERLDQDDLDGARTAIHTAHVTEKIAASASGEARQSKITHEGNGAGTTINVLAIFNDILGGEVAT